MNRDLENHMVLSDEDTERERNSWPEEQEYDKYLAEKADRCEDGDLGPRFQHHPDEYYERCEKREPSVELRLSLAICNLASGCANWNEIIHCLRIVAVRTTDEDLAFRCKLTADLMELKQWTDHIDLLQLLKDCKRRIEG